MKQVIRFCYRKIIDVSSSTAWERLIVEDSYTEFKMQCQRFNEGGKYSSFGEMLHNNPSAEQLHFLTSAAAVGYVKQLNNIMPDVKNTLGKRFLPFSNFKFEIINSDIKDIKKHRVAVSFYSNPVQWITTVGNAMILAVNNTVENDELLTDTFVVPSFVSIYSIKQTD